MNQPVEDIVGSHSSFSEVADDDIFAEALHRIAVAQDGSCTCGTKTSDFLYHKLPCDYRRMREMEVEFEDFVFWLHRRKNLAIKHVDKNSG